MLFGHPGVAVPLMNANSSVELPRGPRQIPPDGLECESVTFLEVRIECNGSRHTRIDSQVRPQTLFLSRSVWNDICRVVISIAFWKPEVMGSIMEQVFNSLKDSVTATDFAMKMRDLSRLCALPSHVESDEVHQNHVSDGGDLALRIKKPAMLPPLAFRQFNVHIFTVRTRFKLTALEFHREILRDCRCERFVLSDFRHCSRSSQSVQPDM